MKIKSILALAIFVMSTQACASSSSSSKKEEGANVKTTADSKKLSVNDRLKALSKVMHNTAVKPAAFPKIDAERLKQKLEIKELLNQVNLQLKKVYFSKADVQGSLQHSYDCVIEAQQTMATLQKLLKHDNAFQPSEGKQQQILAQVFQGEAKKLHATNIHLKRVFSDLAKWISAKDSELWEGRIQPMGASPVCATPKTQEWLKMNQPDNPKRKGYLFTLKLEAHKILHALREYEILEDEMLDEKDEEEKI